MKKIRYSLLILALTMGFCLSVSAQDSRNRVTSTIIADGLAQLPAKDLNVCQQVIGEMAATGTEGMQMLISYLAPSVQAKNAKFEYAIDGIVSYVSEKNDATLTGNIRKALAEGIEKQSDPVNKAFLMSQLQKIATPADAPLFEKYLGDKVLGEPATAAIATIGNAAVVKELVEKATAPKAALAKLVQMVPVTGVENTLASWASGADTKTLAAIYNALAACGTDKSFSLLHNAAKAVGFNDDPTGATDAYLKYLHSNVGDLKLLGKAAKELMKSSNGAVRNSGLEIMGKSLGYADGIGNDYLLLPSTKLVKAVLTALKDGDRQYRNTALRMLWGSTLNDTQKSAAAASVAKAFPGLTDDAKIDVVRWLGNNHAEDQIDVITKQMTSPNDELAEAAIKAAGKIGGKKALTALISLLGGEKAALATQTLLAFNGNINDGVLEALTSNNADVQNVALKLSSDRHIYAAYPLVEALLAKGGKPNAAAYEALKGVVKAENFPTMASLLEGGENVQQVPALQAATAAAIRNLSADEQYKLIADRLDRTGNKAVYYPLLAQAGNSQAIKKLVEEYNKPATADAAFRSLLKVNNPEMIGVLYNIAQSKADLKDNARGRYLQLVNAAGKNDIQKYQLIGNALALNPSDGVASSFVGSLASLHNLPSLKLAAKYLDNKACAVAAANAVKTILAKKPELLAGNEIKANLEKARDVYRAQTDADSGYAVDEINGMLPKAAADGFTSKVEAAKVNAADKRLALPGKYENFELYFEWKTSGNVDVNLRSMPILNLDKEKGSTLYANEYKSEPACGWNSTYVKVVNDRLQMIENGVEVLNNAVMKNSVKDRPINAEGVISWWANEGETEVRNVYVNALPSTPVYELTAEEKKAGFEVLFDGRSLEKWHGNTVNYIPQDGTIYVSAGYGNGGNLYTNKKYSDFVYRFEFCFLEPGVNNGIGIRTRDGVDAAYDGMEIQVLDHDDPIYKGLRPYQQHGAVYGIIVPKHVKFAGTNVWNTEEIRAVGDHITVTVNGEVILDGNIREACQGHNMAPDGSNNNPYTVDHLNHPGLFNKDGYISFCGHGEGVKFRNVRILDLSKQKGKKK